MKKVFSLVLVACVLLSVCILGGCNNSTSTTSKDPYKNIYEDFEDFDSYVDKDADIIGTWTMTSPDTNKEWQFFPSTTLHQTTVTDETRSTNVCTYNYDGEGKLTVYSFNHSGEFAYSVAIHGKELVLTDESGAKMSFVKN